ncbi:ATP-dependent DNA helicase [Commensalibacter oyaizuii]|uniref:ATP-dependent DNA helicase n=1 Tax=Commensalibacter oyaizuii TaxID=3043873 RepID=A0ABT6Q0L3_9PROT|nr:ATP-dependent DNA helicase [Commensalibacter sp. TBRC 16381]MDI2090029.1 ATP-dependent DNA helicase [Commensalibacter sp. TBRC 16381]
MFLEKYSALTVHHNQYSILTDEGEILNLTRQEATKFLKKQVNVFVIHAPITYRKLRNDKNIHTQEWLDILELAAFIYPTQSFGFTPETIAQALNIPCPIQIEADFLLTIIHTLAQRLQEKQTHFPSETLNAQAASLYYAGWKWAPFVLDLLNITLPLPKKNLQPMDGLKVWRRLPKWEETPPRPPPSQKPVERKEALLRLSELLGPNAEDRVGQTDFVDIARTAFAPRQLPDQPNVVLAEAGTGTGKTLAYIAPATLWAERNEGTVWINTYTRHLQRQIENEFFRLYPDPEIKKKHIVVRKGRENYLCLLNLEEILNSYSNQPSLNKIALILLCRWAEETSDGDLFGGDLPSWFNDLFHEKLIYQLAERRGECIHGACPHYQCCFVEHSIHQAQEADIVIANHALVMNQIAWHLENDHPEQQQTFPTRFIFDEAHHILDATDSTYSSALSAIETSELRRWLLGNEGTRSRSKGLKKRIHDVIIGDDKLEYLLEKILQAAHALPSLNWFAHFPVNDNSEHTATNPSEQFFYLVYTQIQARSNKGDPNIPSVEYFDQNECDLFPILPELQSYASTLAECFLNILSPLSQFIKTLEHKLETDVNTLDKFSKDRIETTIASLKRRAVNPLTLWSSILSILSQPDQNKSETETHVTFLKVEKQGQRIVDVGIFHHWLDPTLPFMNSLSHYAHGIIMTSATLRDENENQKDIETSWQAAEKRVGTAHLPIPPTRASLACPFDYKKQSLVFIVNDINTHSIHSLAHAYLRLFVASNGGALGLFTAISRLRAVYQRIIDPLEEENISLFAQHVDPINNNSLIDLFKSENHSCLLGTDAMRDGINIPGDALRLVVFEKIPWPRPDILHRERRKYFYPDTPQLYDGQIVRLRLRQAFGRLIRTQQDRGVFVILDRRTPTRMLSAFPEGVTIQRASLEAVITKVQDFYKDMT